MLGIAPPVLWEGKEASPSGNQIDGEPTSQQKIFVQDQKENLQSWRKTRLDSNGGSRTTNTLSKLSQSSKGSQQSKAQADESKHPTHLGNASNFIRNGKNDLDIFDCKRGLEGQRQGRGKENVQIQGRGSAGSRGTSGLRSDRPRG
ncbi:hypothetical protein Nepgr_008100 [Nepenthes gracilis]|uniref:Uncharacterized protein n=1 Tax=Nepenthes gracilis TaxID=150966 RepID=A0AAD3S858_NEPGR|nr:hypothetical protein Nepgr_008100 [Nepenthes gracilis]